MDKKKPGRPKKTIKHDPKESYGIVTTPICPDNIVEMTYFNPQLFKKVFALQKSYSVADIDMHFFQDKILIVSIDHLQKSRIYVTIEGKNLEFYYCKEPIKISIKLECLERIMATISKSHYKIMFVLKENYRSSLYCTLRDQEYNFIETYEIGVMIKSDYMSHVHPDDSAYPIRFRLNSKQFKQKITGICKLVNEFTIQKIPGDPLHMLFKKDKGQSINWTGEFGDEGRIDLKNTLGDELLSVVVVIDYIKPFIMSCMADDIFIAVDSRMPISFMANLDKYNDDYICQVRVFTDINK